MKITAFVLNISIQSGLSAGLVSAQSFLPYNSRSDWYAREVVQGNELEWEKGDSDDIYLCKPLFLNQWAGSGLRQLHPKVDWRTVSYKNGAAIAPAD